VPAGLHGSIAAFEIHCDRPGEGRGREPQLVRGLILPVRRPEPGRGVNGARGELRRPVRHAVVPGRSGLGNAITIAIQVIAAAALDHPKQTIEKKVTSPGWFTCVA